jgi:hypothetical protein
MELGRDRTVREILSRLKIARGRGAVKVEGTWGSFAPLLTSYISKELGRPILYIRPHIDDADKLMTYIPSGLKMSKLSPPGKAKKNWRTPPMKSELKG